MYDQLVQIVLVIMVLNSIKHTIGFHFPWEVCECCGKRYRDHE